MLDLLFLVQALRLLWRLCEAVSVAPAGSHETCKATRKQLKLDLSTDHGAMIGTIETSSLNVID